MERSSCSRSTRRSASAPGRAARRPSSTPNAPCGATDRGRGTPRPYGVSLLPPRSTSSTRLHQVELGSSLPANWSGGQAAGRWETLRTELVRSVRWPRSRSEEHTSELQSQFHLVCRLLLEKKKKRKQ